MKIVFKLEKVMNRSSEYKTKQKEQILEMIKTYNNEFTIKDVYISLNKEIGLTTIYRLIDKLVKDGEVNKNIGKDNITYYQYLESCSNENHFFLKCDICGYMEHVDCNCINELSNHINKNHKFNLNKKNIIINGICNKCGKKYEK